MILHEQPTFNIETDLLKACIHCGMCLPACPTYEVTGSEAESPRGRLYLMKAYGDGNLETPSQLSHHLDACLGCRACESVCPSGVHYGELLTSARVALAPHKPFFERLVKRFVFTSILPRPGVLNGLRVALLSVQHSNFLKKLSPYLKRVTNKFPILTWQWHLLPPLPLEGSPFKAGQQFLAQQQARTASDEKTAPSLQTVALITGCVMDAMFHPIHQATIEVLTLNGYHVVIPQQTCCGALALHDGESDIALKLAKQNIDAILASNPDFIVLNSAGCGATMQEYGHLFRNDSEWSERAQVFSEKVIDIMPLLAKRPIVKPTRQTDKSITYHGACHLHHAQKMTHEVFDVLFQVPGLKFVPMLSFDRCCGSAGIYNIEQPELSQLLLTEKMLTIEATEADVVLTGNPGCLIQILAGAKHLKKKPAVLHPVEFLAYSYGKLDYAAFTDVETPDASKEITSAV